ncbi:Hypothetical protein Nlim_1072 [Candidatus Nitrosarchaeum limnium SFB1]|uniref:Uncharacterized protein n=1 Tax=Candidatus Nitrosarchaeum limnium SFB1 TaxID=886738 RepID=F3KKP8_9ARCH|nr:Hypothetical protein Nlim_1072 [Candidatus Nitrosarchaeum limnium SFB1]
MEDFKKYISTNFILLSADTTVEEAYSKIDLVKPEFVLVYKLDKLDEEKLLYYTFLAKLLSEFRKDKPGMVEPTYKLDQFLDLLENKENKTSEISDVIPSANDPAVDDLIQNNKDSSDLIPLFHGDFIVGVFDPNRQNANFLYILKGYNFSVQRKSLFPEPEDKSSKTKLIGKGIIPKVRSFRSFLSSEYTDSIGERIVDTSSEETTPRKPNAETPTKIGKFASVKMRKNMKIGTKESLLVQLQSKKPPEEELPEGQFVVDVSYPAGVSNVELLVLATSSNSEIAEIQDQKPKDMIVPKDGDSNIVEFTIIPKKEGVFTITTFIFFKSNPLTILQSHAKVGNITNDSICGSSGVVNPDTNNPGADLLIIFEKTGGRSYGITVIAPELGIRHQKFECVKITESLKRYCRSTLAKIEKISPYEYTPDDIKKSLSGIGTDLYNRIFPNSFKEFYWKHKRENHFDSSNFR